MGPIHLYLGAWVLGGVLLGASMLLDAREPPAASSEPERADGPPTLSGGALAAAPVLKERGRLARGLRVLPLGLIGFGLSGLLARGLEVDVGPWTLLIALSVGLCLIALGYRLSRAGSASAPR